MKFVAVGAVAFIVQIICAVMAVADVAGKPVVWIALALGFNAAGNLMGGVKAGGSEPLEVRATIVTSKPAGEAEERAAS